MGVEFNKLGTLETLEILIRNLDNAKFIFWESEILDCLNIIETVKKIINELDENNLQIYMNGIAIVSRKIQRAYYANNFMNFNEIVQFNQMVDLLNLLTKKDLLQKING